MRARADKLAGGVRSLAPVPLSNTLQQAWLKRGPLALALLPLSAVYGLLQGARALLYRAGLLRSVRLQVPVIVAGNLLAGGVGKTPTVMAVVSLLRRHGYTPGILSRGHGRANVDEILEVQAATPATACGDEPKLLHLRTAAPVVVGRNRVAAGRFLLHRHPEIDIIVCDDGLQHLALARDAQVIVFDERGVGNGWLLPAGPLREPFAVRIPRRSIALYNAPQRSTPWPGSLGQRRLTGLVDLQAWWDDANPAPVAPQSLRGQPLIAAAGIANPQRFFDMLRECGLNFEEIALPDHHAFSELPWPRTAEHVVITEKDAVKIAPGRAGPTHIWVAALDFHVDAVFEAELMALLPARPLRETAHGSPSA